ncbi:unnamed protein product [Polarella glacialis]|uniref:Uncharacterized protein n=1 Tax=Polarella glacialis TaxID=89957 RepID=A0A813DXK4_POLGL|nr:unnamed protein product [Polarella glacialis]
MTQNFGFHRLENGTCEVYHHGQSFYGPFPIRILFQVHAKYVAWATERFVNCSAFGDEDKADEAAVQRADMPLHVFKEFLEGLHHDVQQALEHQRAKSKPTARIEATLKQLKQEISKVGPDSCPIAAANVAKVRHVAKTAKSPVSKIQITVHCAGCQDTINEALTHIGATDAIQSRRLCKQKIEEQGYSCDKSHSEPKAL